MDCHRYERRDSRHGPAGAEADMSLELQSCITLGGATVYRHAISRYRHAEDDTLPTYRKKGRTETQALDLRLYEGARVV